MPKMVKKQNRINKKKEKGGIRNQEKSLEIKNPAAVLELPKPVSIQEPELESKVRSAVSEKAAESVIEKERIKVPEQPGHSEAAPGPAVEEAAAILIEEKLELLGFQMNQEEYAIPTSQVKEIIRPAELTVIPGSSPILLGITSLRGVIIPVFSLSKKMAQLKMSRADESKPDQREESEKLKRIIIIQIDQGFFGLMVDGVTDVIKIMEKAVQPPPSLLNQMGQEMIKGITRFKNRLIILLFIARIVDLIQDEIKKIRKT